MTIGEQRGGAQREGVDLILEVLKLVVVPTTINVVILILLTACIRITTIVIVIIIIGIIIIIAVFVLTIGEQIDGAPSEDVVYIII